jgi:hypothetical protein
MNTESSSASFPRSFPKSQGRQLSHYWKYNNILNRLCLQVSECLLDFSLPLELLPATDEVSEPGARFLLLVIERSYPIQQPLQLNLQGLRMPHLPAL